MQQYIIFATVILAASPAHAHMGHLGEVAGHDHWIGLAALGAAVIAGALVAAKKAKDKKLAAAEQDNDTETQESAA